MSSPITHVNHIVDSTHTCCKGVSLCQRWRDDKKQNCIRRWVGDLQVRKTKLSKLMLVLQDSMTIPSDTKLLLMKNYSEIIIFKNYDFICNSLKKSFFPGNFEGANPLKNTKNNSQGIIFVIVSCQRVHFEKVANLIARACDYHLAGS